MQKSAVANPLFVTFLTINVTLLVAAVAGGTKIVQIGPFTFAATVIAYSLTFLVTDAASELLGREAASQIVKSGFLAMIMALAFFQIALRLPASPLYEQGDAYQSVFGVAWRFVLGGVIAYLSSQFLDVTLFHKIRKATGGKFLWLRNNVSTLISQAIDTFIFVTIAFYGQVGNLFLIYEGQYTIKIVIAAADTLLLYALVGLIRRPTSQK